MGGSANAKKENNHLYDSDSDGSGADRFYALYSLCEGATAGKTGNFGTPGNCSSGSGEAMSNDTLYIKIDRNVEVHDKRVVLGDIAQLICTDQNVENKLRTMKIEGATDGKPGRHAMSLMEIIAQIQKEYPNLEVNNIGEYDFIVTYPKKKSPGVWTSWTKTILVCLIAFFGAAFTIMTFNNDVDLPKLFGQVYKQVTGSTSDGFTILELMYSIGVGLGILIFFNHFAGRKLTHDPTPMEVEMRA